MAEIPADPIDKCLPSVLSGKFCHLVSRSDYGSDTNGRIQASKHGQLLETFRLICFILQASTLIMYSPTGKLDTERGAVGVREVRDRSHQGVTFPPHFHETRLPPLSTSSRPVMRNLMRVFGPPTSAASGQIVVNRGTQEVATKMDPETRHLATRRCGDLVQTGLRILQTSKWSI
jgi:hypothetical protein